MSTNIPFLEPEIKKIIPSIDRNRCEGKGPCVDICPYDALVVRTLPKEERQSLSISAKIKGFVHGWQQAFIDNPDQCLGCGLCVSACPEKAIKLVRIK